MAVSNPNICNLASQIASVWSCRSGGVGAKEQIAERPAQQVGDTPPCQVVWAVMDQMAALAEALEVAQPIISRIVVKMGGGQHDTGLSYPYCLRDIRPVGRSAAVIAPGVLRGIEPATIRQTANGHA